MNIDNLLRQAREMRVSDVHISEGMPTMFRIDGSLAKAPVDYKDSEILDMMDSILNSKMKKDFEAGDDVDFAYALPDKTRYRVNFFHQQGKAAGTIRLLNDEIPSLEALKLPPVLRTLADQARGLILITGPTGSGKSTTLASMIDYVNSNRAEHIITIENPIEYAYENKRALIHQREVGRDVESFAEALRSSLREDPDIILVGEMRDYETISAALTAAETGHLVMSTLHTTGAAQTIDRIIDACPNGSQNQVRTQLAGVLKGVVTQCLIPTIGGGRVAATEVLTGSDAVLNMIRENKGHQLKSMIQSGANEGMHTLNSDLAALVNQNRITVEDAFKFSYDKKDLQQFLRY